MPPVVVLAGVMCVLSVTPASAQASSHDADGAPQASSYVVSAPAPASTYVVSGLPEASCDYWRYH